MVRQDNVHLARIRENQRRSRDRRKGYMEDMQRQLAEYERKGVEASTLLQAAARKVHQENSRLRTLLRLKGVPDAEVQDYLATGQAPSAGAVATVPYSASSSSGITTRSPNGLDTAASSPLVAAQPPVASLAQADVSGSYSYRSSVVADGWGRETAGQIAHHHGNPAAADAGHEITRTLSSGIKEAQSEVARLTATEQICCSQPALEGYADNRPPDNTTTCLEAAVIIASMHGNIMVDDVAAELGCSSGENCRVDNLTVFQAMDKRGV